MRGFRRLTLEWLILWLCVMLARAADAGPKIEVLEGDGAINNIRLHRAKEPVVRVVDAEGRPLANVAVTFILPGTGPGATFADNLNSLTAMTDENGQAVGRNLRPNRLAGQFQIRVTTSYQGMMTTANITQTNAEPAKSGSSKTLLLVALIGGGAAAGVALALGKKSSSSGTASTSSGVVINPGNPSFGPPQ
jgi:hypothetical protein